MKLEKIFLQPNINCKLENKSSSSAKYVNEHPSLDLVMPCDSYYLTKKNNINFKGNYKLQRLSSTELNELKSKVEKKVAELGNPNFRIDYNNWDNDYVVQAIDKLINHPIMDKGNIVSDIENIYATILTNHYQKKDSEALLKLIDFLASDELKPIMENQSVKDDLGNILAFTNHSNIEPVKKFFNYLKDNPELLKKDVDIAGYIDFICDDESYEQAVKILNSPNAPNGPFFLPEKELPYITITSKVI